MAEKIVRVPSADNLAWVDLEMTGLDPEVHVILQAAVIVTNAQLEPLESYACDIWQPEEALGHMSPFVRDMHDKNGLIERVRASRLDVGAAERRILERVSGWCTYPAILCGNSVGQDKRFIDRYMPGLGGYLSYRIVDVSSLKILARAWYGEAAVYKKPEKGEHDALVDIQNSIDELCHYRKSLFREA